MTQPLEQLSIIIPALNIEPWLDLLSRQIQAFLRSSYEVEVLLIDNGSTDEGIKKLKSIFSVNPKVRFLQSEKGIVPALNEGIRKSKSSWLMRHDADDFSSSERISSFFKHVSSISDPSRISIITSETLVIGSKNEIYAVHRPDGPRFNLKESLKRGKSLIHGSVFLNKYWLEKAGGYRSKFNHAEDQDLWSRLAAICPEVEVIQKPLYAFRENDQSVSAKNLEEQLSHDSPLDPSELSVWSPRVRAAITRLTLSGLKKQAIRLAFKEKRFALPRFQDFAVPLRIIANPWIDRIRGHYLEAKHPNISSFKSEIDQDSSL